MKIEAPEHLSPWLEKELQPICDAEPSALAKYVMALLKRTDKTDEEVREFCSGQLEVFLQQNTKKFVEKLFNAIRDRLYIPAKEETPSPPQPKKTVASAGSSDPTSPAQRERRREDTRKTEAKDTSSRAAPSAASANVAPSDRDEYHRRREGPSSAPDRRREETTPSQQRYEASSDTSRQQSPPPPPPPTSQGSSQEQRAVRKRISPPPAEDSSREKKTVRDPYGRRRSRSPARDSRRPPRASGRRSPVDRGSGRDRDRRRSRSRSRSRTPDRRRDDERRKRRCRDFDERGICRRGDSCPYDHGPDPLVVEDSHLEKFQENMMMKMGNGAPNFSVPPPGYNPLNPPPPGVDFNAPPPPPPRAPVEGYNPEAPSLSAAGTGAGGPNFSIPPPPLPVLVSNQPWHGGVNYTAPTSANVVIQPVASYDPSSGIPVDPSMGSQQSVNTVSVRGMYRGRGRGRGGFGRGGFAGQGGQNQGDGKTLHVRKIPQDFNNITKLNEHFAQFGNIVNIQVRSGGDPQSALITYASRHEMMNAYKSPQPVLNNRFIKVFIYNPEINPQAQQDAQNPNMTKPDDENMPLQPAPPMEKPKIATVQESKFVNPEVQDERRKLVEAKINLRKEQVNLRSQLSLLAPKVDLHAKVASAQKTLLTKLRNVGDGDRERITEMIKKNGERLATCQKDTNEVKAKVEEARRKIAEYEAIIAASAPSRKEGSAEAEAGAEDDDNSPPPTSKMLKRTAAESGISDYDENEPKRRVGIIAIKGFKPDDEQELIVHMEQYGELIDVDYVGTDTVLFKFKKYERAAAALEANDAFKGERLDMSWYRKSAGSDVVPDYDRASSEQVTATQLLAGIGNEESDEDY